MRKSMFLVVALLACVLLAQPALASIPCACPKNCGDGTCCKDGYGGVPNCVGKENCDSCPADCPGCGGCTCPATCKGDNAVQYNCILEASCSGSCAVRREYTRQFIFCDCLGVPCYAAGAGPGFDPGTGVLFSGSPLDALSNPAFFIKGKCKTLTEGDGCMPPESMFDCPVDSTQSCPGNTACAIGGGGLFVGDCACKIGSCGGTCEWTIIMGPPIQISDTCGGTVECDRCDSGKWYECEDVSDYCVSPSCQCEPRDCPGIETALCTNMGCDASSCGADSGCDGWNPDTDPAKNCGSDDCDINAHPTILYADKDCESDCSCTYDNTYTCNAANECQSADCSASAHKCTTALGPGGWQWYQSANIPEESMDEGNCNDGVDNDCDGLRDGSDPDCSVLEIERLGIEDLYSEKEVFVGNKMTSTTVVRNKGDIPSPNYKLKHILYRIDEVSGVGFDVGSPSAASQESLPGGKRRYTNVEWDMSVDGDYIVNATLMYMDDSFIDSREIRVRVRVPANIIASEYPPILLLVVVVALPVAAFFFLKKREEEGLELL